MTNAEKVKAYLTSPILVVQENILIILKQGTRGSIRGSPKTVVFSTRR